MAHVGTEVSRPATSVVTSKKPGIRCNLCKTVSKNQQAYEFHIGTILHRTKAEEQSRKISEQKLDMKKVDPGDKPQETKPNFAKKSTSKMSRNSSPGPQIVGDKYNSQNTVHHEKKVVNGVINGQIKTTNKNRSNTRQETMSNSVAKDIYNKKDSTNDVTIKELDGSLLDPIMSTSSNGHLDEELEEGEIFEEENEQNIVDKENVEADSKSTIEGDEEMSVDCKIKPKFFLSKDTMKGMFKAALTQINPVKETVENNTNKDNEVKIKCLSPVLVESGGSDTESVSQTLGRPLTPSSGKGNLFENLSAFSTCIKSPDIRNNVECMCTDEVDCQISSQIKSSDKVLGHRKEENSEKRNEPENNVKSIDNIAVEDDNQKTKEPLNKNTDDHLDGTDAQLVISRDYINETNGDIIVFREKDTDSKEDSFQNTNENHSACSDINSEPSSGCAFMEVDSEIVPVQEIQPERNHSVEKSSLKMYSKCMKQKDIQSGHGMKETEQKQGTIEKSTYSVEEIEQTIESNRCSEKEESEKTTPAIESNTCSEKESEQTVPTILSNKCSENETNDIKETISNNLCISHATVVDMVSTGCSNKEETASGKINGMLEPSNQLMSKSASNEYIFNNDIVSCSDMKSVNVDEDMCSTAECSIVKEAVEKLVAETCERVNAEDTSLNNEKCQPVEGETDTSPFQVIEGSDEIGIGNESESGEKPEECTEVANAGNRNINLGTDSDPELLSISSDNDKNETETKDIEMKNDLNERDSSFMCNQSSEQKADTDCIEHKTQTIDTVQCDKKEITNVATGSLKRTHPSSPDTESETKRSRLDSMVGRLGTALGVKPAEVKDESISDEESMTSTDTSQEVDSKVIFLTAKDLDSLIKKKMDFYVGGTHNSVVTQLQKKVQELREQSERWKSQVKKLQERVIDLSTLVSSRAERRVRKVPTRHVAIQMGGDLTMNRLQASMQGHRSSSQFLKSPTRSAAQPTLGPGLLLATKPTMVLQQSAGITANTSNVQQVQYVASSDLKNVQQTGNNKTQVVYTTQLTSIMGKPTTTAAPSQPPPRGATVKDMLDSKRGLGTTTVQSPSKIIDLTSDEESAKASKGATVQHLLSTPQVAAGKSTVLQASAPVNSVNLAAAGLKPGTYIIQQTSGVPQIQPARLQAADPQGAMVVYSSQASAPGSLMVQPTTPATFVQSGSGNVLRGQLVPVSKSTTGQTVRQVLQQKQTTSAGKTQGVSARTSVSQQAQLQQESPSASLTKSSDDVVILKHPAPLPSPQTNQHFSGLKLAPPKPGLKISRVAQGIVLSWYMALDDKYADIAEYQLFAYHEGSAPPSTTLWKKVGDVLALPLPMACTLTQFQEGNRYHFAVRALDKHKRVGVFSDISSIHLQKIEK